MKKFNRLTSNLKLRIEVALKEIACISKSKREEELMNYIVNKAIGDGYNNIAENLIESINIYPSLSREAVAALICLAGEFQTEAKKSYERENM